MKKVHFKESESKEVHSSFRISEQIHYILFHQKNLRIWGHLCAWDKVENLYCTPVILERGEEGLLQIVIQ